MGRDNVMKMTFGGYVKRLKAEGVPEAGHVEMYVKSRQDKPRDVRRRIKIERQKKYISLENYQALTAAVKRFKKMHFESRLVDVTGDDWQSLGNGAHVRRTRRPRDV